MFTFIRKIGNHYYKYSHHRENGKIISKYLGKTTQQEHDAYKRKVQQNKCYQCNQPIRIGQKVIREENGRHTHQKCHKGKPQQTWVRRT